MNTKQATTNRVPAEFAAETQFELRPAPSAALRAARAAEFERLKARLLARELSAASTPELDTPCARPPMRRRRWPGKRRFPRWCSPPCSRKKPVLALRQANRQARIGRAGAGGGMNATRFDNGAPAGGGRVHECKRLARHS